MSVPLCAPLTAPYTVVAQHVVCSPTLTGRAQCCLCRTAQKREIIKAYRKLAQQWHPDNFQDPEDKKAAEKKFIDIAQAKEVLTDPGR